MEKQAIIVEKFSLKLGQLFNSKGIQLDSAKRARLVRRTINHRLAQTQRSSITPNSLGNILCVLGKLQKSQLEDLETEPDEVVKYIDIDTTSKLNTTNNAYHELENSTRKCQLCEANTVISQTTGGGSRSGCGKSNNLLFHCWTCNGDYFQ